MRYTVEKPENEMELFKLRDSFSNRMCEIRNIILKDVKSEMISDLFVKTLEYILKLENYNTYEHMMYVYKSFLLDMIDFL